MNAAQATTQIAYVAAIALAMVTAGLGKRRLEWKPPKPRRRKKHSDRITWRNRHRADL
jgi:hypothetical protein